MRDAIWEALFETGFMPHGYCLLWDPTLFWTHAVSDALIAISYFSIPAVLIVFALRRTDFEFRWVLNLFGLFIVACGLTHVMGIWTLWVPSYSLEAMLKVITALVSCATAVLLWPLIPRVLALPSHAELERQNEALANEIRRHRETQAQLARLNRELEARVAARTADLEAKNEELGRAILQAEEANESKSRFLSMMSHEIRTPLNAVINMSELLQEQPRTQTDRNYLRTIGTSSKALLSIVEDILDFSRIEAGGLKIERVETDLEEIVEEVIESIAPLAHERGLDLASTIGSNLPATAMVDPARLRQILLNLVGNAVKYTERGWVHVEVDLVVRGDGDVLVFDVIDTGIGIARQDLERIFERFSQIEGDHAGGTNGTGLGLSIARRLAEAMGGSIGVNSEIGTGSAFRLVLPVERYSEPVAFPDLPEVALVGPDTRTRASLASMLVAMGARVHLHDEITPESAASASRVRIAFVIAPVSLSADFDAAEWCGHAARLAERVVLLLPVGRIHDRLDNLIASGVSIDTYPARRQDLASTLTRTAQQDDRQGHDDAKKTLLGVRVLVVDDNEENRLVAERGLGVWGAEVVTAENGFQAINAVAAEDIDLVLMDLRMPGMDGYTAARRIRASDGPWSTVTILAVSANITAETIELIEAAGMNGHLAKPFRPRDLREIVERYVSQRRREDSAAGAVKPPLPEAPGSGESPAKVEAPSSGEPSVSNDAPLLDTEILDEAFEYTNRETVERLIERFVSLLGERLSAIEDAATAEARADAAHGLAGAAGALGLTLLSERCKAEENRVRGQDDATTAGAAATSAMQAIREASSCGREALEKWREEHLSTSAAE